MSPNPATGILKSPFGGIVSQHVLPCATACSHSHEVSPSSSRVKRLTLKEPSPSGLLFVAMKWCRLDSILSFNNLFFTSHEILIWNKRMGKCEKRYRQTHTQRRKVHSFPVRSSTTYAWKISPLSHFKMIKNSVLLMGALCNAASCTLGTKRTGADILNFPSLRFLS